ncbi:MAG: helix-turn-helix domain-containing protein [Mesorhizobium sp.]|nr:MAG: DNA-binding protein [Mesorhizobium sp.]TIW48448.1 MAG: helix-turn-helix domain-containing protein [Mesorhizobium sp.]
MTLPRAMTPKMVADLWLCSERHVRNLIATGDLPSFKLGGKLLRIRGEDVEAYECRTTGASHDSGAALPLHSTGTENVTAIHSAPVIRAKLNALRQPSLRS